MQNIDSFLYKTFSFLLCCCMALTSPLALSAMPQQKKDQKPQPGKISGSVKSTKTGAPVAGVAVMVVGTTTGGFTDLNGLYSINEVPAGTYSIKVSAIGYVQKTIPSVQVKAAATTLLDIPLKPKTTSLQAVTIKAAIPSHTATGLLAINRNAVGLQDGVSSQYLKKADVSNAASAMKHITGVTLLHDNEVFVRGLGPRYTDILLNGASVPSTSATKEKAPIDIIGAGLVDHITIKKTYTPSEPAEFAGGTVEIATLEFPEKQQISFSYSTSIHSVSAFRNTLSNNKIHLTGFGSGTHRLPALLESQRLTRENKDQVAASFPNSWALDNHKKTIPSQKISFTYADQYNEEKIPIGLVSSFVYAYDRDFKPRQELRTISSYVTQNKNFLLRSNYRQNTGLEQVKIGGMFNLFIKPSSHTIIGWKNLYANFLNNSTQVIQGDYFNYLDTTRQTIYDFDRKSLFSSVLTFNTVSLPFYHSKLSFTANYSRALRNRPDRRSTQYNLDRAGKYLIYFDDAGNSRYYSNQKDNNYTVKADYQIEPDPALTLKTGLSAVFKSRDFNARRFEYRNFSNQFPEELLDAPPAVALDPSLVLEDKLELRETTAPRDSYVGAQKIIAGYISSIWRLTDYLKVQLGVRIERSDMRVDILEDKKTKRIAHITRTDLLPATNITYDITKKLKLKSAFSLTLARPNFREISNFRFQDFVGGQTIYGNPNLEQTQIQNYDLSLEYYPSYGALFSAGIFYKKLDNPIALFYRFTEAVEVEYRNADKATLLGIEVTGRKQLTQKLQFIANLSYIYSRAQVKKADRFAVAHAKRPMYGQSPYTANLAMFYSFPVPGLSFSLNYHTFGKRLIRVGKRAQGFDEYEQPFNTLNCGLSYKFGSTPVTTISAGIDNILNNNIVYKQGNITTFYYRPGQTYKISLSLSL